MRIAFAGTPEFAACALRALLAAGHEIALVLTQPDRPAGRGLKLQASAVKQVAQQHALALVQPRGLKLDGRWADDARAAQAALAAAAAQCLVVAAYGLILPAWVLALPARGCVNIHASLLPRWRGAAPIQRAIEAGDGETGITLMQMDEGLDTGAMLLRRSLPITADDTAATLHDRLAALGAEAIQQLLATPRWQPQPQPTDGVTYAHKIDKAEARIDWRQPAATIERRLRAFDPHPGANFTLDGETVKLWRADPVTTSSGAPGEVVVADAGRLVVACGAGALALRELQRPGGRRLDAATLMRSMPSLAGRRLGGAD